MKYEHGTSVERKKRGKNWYVAYHKPNDDKIKPGPPRLTGWPLIVLAMVRPR